MGKAPPATGKGSTKKVVKPGDVPKRPSVNKRDQEGLALGSAHD